MSLVFARRASALELMDTQALDAAGTARVLGTLETINTWLGGVETTLSPLRRFSQRWEPGQRIRFLDLGTGGADIPRAIVRWCRAQGFQSEVTGLDNNAEIVDYARDQCRTYPEITIVQGDITSLGPEPPEPFDYAISSLTLHHLTNDQILGLLKEADRLARRGLVMNDLKRSGRAWAWIWLLTRLGRAPAMVQNDAPLSVRRAFTRRELMALAQEAGLPYLRVQSHFGYRLSLSGEKHV